MISSDRCCLPGGTSLASHGAVGGSRIPIIRGAGAAPAPRDSPNWHRHRLLPGEQVNPARHTGHPGRVLSQEGGFVPGGYLRVF